MTDNRAVAVAHPNIALAKYWGKCEIGTNLPAVPSLSVTLAGMRTRTEVRTAAELDQDRLLLDGQQEKGQQLARVSRLLDYIGGEQRQRAEVRSNNDFPTAAGLASSASGFAALAVAANEALRAGRSTAELSCMARRVSASAGRSLFGGFVELPAGRDGEARLAARQIASRDHWDVKLVVAVTTEEKKTVGSTEGMKHTASTSPLYSAWVQHAPAIFARVREAVLARDLEALGQAVELSALAMHGVALAAEPGLLYWNGTTVELMQAVRRMRQGGLAAYFTIDAGPHVKVLTTVDQLADVAQAIASVDGVVRTIVTEPGRGAHLVVDEVAGEGA